MTEHSNHPSDHRILKIAGGLLVLAVVLIALFLLPLTTKAPSGGPDVHLPSMQNIPEATSLQFEIAPKQSN